MTLDALNAAIRSRRVVRSMTEDPIPPEILETIVRSAHFAPNAGNRRLQRLVPVADPRLLRLLRLVSPGMVPRPRAALVICLDLERAARFRMDERTPGLLVDVGTLAATILLAAHGAGVGSCPVTSFSRAAVARLLGLDAGLLPWMIVCLGYPADGQPPPMSVRAAPDAAG